VAGLPRPPLSAGLIFELCAGIVDKPGLSLESIAKEEILEEVGYDVPLKSIRKVTTFLSAVGISGARQVIFAADVDDSMAVVDGCGDEDGSAGNNNNSVVGGGLAEHGEAIEV
jgi:UDP-sugar diphosphatase